MHAAALAGASMLDVLRWVADPDAYAGEVQKPPAPFAAAGDS